MLTRDLFAVANLLVKHSHSHGTRICEIQLGASVDERRSFMLLVCGARGLEASALRFVIIRSTASPPLPFGRICFVVLVMRKGGESS